MDAILGYPWMKCRGLGIWSKTDSLLRNPKNGIWWYLDDWRGTIQSMENPWDKEEESSNESEDETDDEEMLNMQEYMRLRRMQLSMPELEIEEEGDAFGIEH